MRQWTVAIFWRKSPSMCAMVSAMPSWRRNVLCVAEQCWRVRYGTSIEAVLCVYRRMRPGAATIPFLLQKMLWSMPPTGVRATFTTLFAGWLNGANQLNSVLMAVISLFDEQLLIAIGI